MEICIFTKFKKLGCPKKVNLSLLYKKRTIHI